MGIYLGSSKTKMIVNNIPTSFYIGSPMPPPLFTNLVPKSINADGTIYNNGLGYKHSYRVRSGGAEQSLVYGEGGCTGYIPAKGGDIVRVHTLDNFLQTSTANAINVSDSSFTNLGQIVGNHVQGYGIYEGNEDLVPYNWTSVIEESENVYKWVVPPNQNIAYIRVTAMVKDADYSTFIVTVNEEIIF